MSRHYLLDGYNILKKTAALANLPLEEGRRAFLRWIEYNRPQGSVNNKVVVVFDGHPDHFGGGHEGETRVIFSVRGSADDEIKRMVEQDADCKNCVVVSDDKDVYLYARSLGAQVMSVTEFTKTSLPLKSTKQTSRHAKNPEEKYISLSRQAKINQEFTKIWLKEKQ